MQRNQRARFSRHIGDIEGLLDRADCSRESVELVLAPVELHQRNLKRRLRQVQRTYNAFNLTDPTDVAVNVLAAAGKSTRRLDRIDRLSLLRVALENDALVGDATNVTARHLTDPDQVEQIRTEVEAVTNLTPAHIDTLRRVASGLRSPVDVDAREAIEVALAAQDMLDERTDRVVSDAALVRHATQLLHDTGGTAWNEVYPQIARCSLVGLSSIPAPQADFLAAIAETTETDVHVYFGQATGSYLTARHPSVGGNRALDRARQSERNVRLGLAEPIDSAPVPAVELTARTRHAEARVAMALVSGLRTAGVPARDVTVIARDLTPYEEPLRRAARQWGITPTFWTQLYVTRTRPFALVDAVCRLLDADAPDRQTLFRPLEYRWAPPDTDRNSDRWPVNSTRLSELSSALPTSGRSLATWQRHLQDAATGDDRLATYVTWLRDRPDPTPSSVEDLFDTLAETYERVGLPVTQADDSADFVETEEDARAVVRLRELAAQVSRKYREHREERTVTQSWGDIADLARLVARQRPGRREHSNARAVDVFEASDVWALNIPYVVVVGLVDGEWPISTASPLPAELREAILSGNGAASSLTPRTQWSVGRDADHFAAAVSAATQGLMFTRYTETTDGRPAHPSPFLADRDTTTVSTAETDRLLSADQVLPGAVQDFLAGGSDG